jgi:hypothetical protein
MHMSACTLTPAPASLSSLLTLSLKWWKKKKRKGKKKKEKRGYGLHDHILIDAQIQLLALVSSLEFEQDMNNFGMAFMAQG